MKVKLLSRVRPSATPWTAAYQAPPSVGFSRQEYWSGLPLPSLILISTSFLIPKQGKFYVNSCKYNVNAMEIVECCFLELSGEKKILGWGGDF